MTAPASFNRVLAVLRRLSPEFPSTDDDTRVGKELRSIAAALGLAYDRYDAVPDEMFPDSTVELIDRWEGVTRVAVRTADDIALRRARVLAVLRRTSGPRLDQLEKLLAPVLDLDADDIIFLEQQRQFIEEALTETTTTTYAITASATEITVNRPWPGKVDGTGVRLYLKLSALGTPTVTVRSPHGTVWTVSVTAAEGWYQTRSVFTGQHAGGTWTISVANGSAVNLTELRLLVSNDVDSAQIYYFYAFRDPALAGTPDIPEAQRLFKRTALAHMKANVIERTAFILGDEHSLLGREPLGGP